MTCTLIAIGCLMFGASVGTLVAAMCFAARDN
jgi:hypothetical protein